MLLLLTSGECSSAAADGVGLTAAVVVAAAVAVGAVGPTATAAPVGIAIKKTKTPP